MHYKFHEVNLNLGGSYIPSPKFLQNKKATINPKNHEHECFLYAIIAALHHQDVKYNPERISNIKPFINQYNLKERKFPSHKKDWKKFESNNKSIAINILYVPHNTEKIRHVY